MHSNVFLKINLQRRHVIYLTVPKPAVHRGQTTTPELVDINNPIIETIWLKLQWGGCRREANNRVNRNHKHLFPENTVIVMWKAATHINSHLARVEVINVEGHIETSAVVLLNFKKVMCACVTLTQTF